MHLVAGWRLHLGRDVFAGQPVCALLPCPGREAGRSRRPFHGQQPGLCVRLAGPVRHRCRPGSDQPQSHQGGPAALPGDQQCTARAGRRPTGAAGQDRRGQGRFSRQGCQGAHPRRCEGGHQCHDDGEACRQAERGSQAQLAIWTLLHQVCSSEKNRPSWVTDIRSGTTGMPKACIVPTAAAFSHGVSVRVPYIFA